MRLSGRPGHPDQILGTIDGPRHRLRRPADHEGEVPDRRATRTRLEPNRTAALSRGARSLRGMGDSAIVLTQAGSNPSDGTYCTNASLQAPRKLSRLSGSR